MPTVTELRNEIETANNKFMLAYGKGDAAGIASLYTDDAEVLPPNSEMGVGKPAIQALWRNVMSSGIKGVKMEIAEVEQHADTAIEVSRYQLLGEGDKILDRGKYLVVWKHDHGEWKLYRDIFNSSVPLPQSRVENGIVIAGTEWVNVARDLSQSRAE
jgi:uncharacterized protein (TIGR02246 family)